LGFVLGVFCYNEAEIIAAKIAAFMIYLNKTAIRGKKFQDRVLPNSAEVNPQQ